MLRNAYLEDKTIHVLNEKEALKIQNSSYLGLRGWGQGRALAPGRSRWDRQQY